MVAGQRAQERPVPISNTAVNLRIDLGCTAEQAGSSGRWQPLFLGVFMKSYLEEVVNDLRNIFGERTFCPSDLPAYYEHAKKLCKWLEKKGAIERVGVRERKFLCFTIKEPLYQIKTS